VELQLALVEKEFALYLSGRWRFFLRKSHFYRCFFPFMNWNWRIVQPICIIDAVNPSKHGRGWRIYRKFEPYSAVSGGSRTKRSADESQFLGRDMTTESILVLDDNAGERMVPEVSGGMTIWEHVHRYAFACRFVVGKRVLDIASGEGYGAAALQKAGAAHVIISQSACHAGQGALRRAVGHQTKLGESVNAISAVSSFRHTERSIERWPAE
jgi:hypothetical protein